jgi:hypothetical protein
VRFVKLYFCKPIARVMLSIVSRSWSLSMLAYVILGRILLRVIGWM